MKLKCPDPACVIKNSSPLFRPIVRKGFYCRKNDGQWIRRYRCLSCKKRFSSSALTPSYRQKKRTLNTPIASLSSAGLSQRKVALYLGVSRKTVARKLRFQAEQSRQRQVVPLKPRDGSILTATNSPLSRVA